MSVSYDTTGKRFKPIQPLSLSTGENEPTPKHTIGLGDFVGTFGTNLFIQVCTIFQGIIVARLLGPLGRGEYAAVILWPSLFAALSILGSNISISRLAAKGVDPGSLFRSAFLTGVATSSLGGILCYFAIPFLMPAKEAHLIPLARLFVLVIPLNHLALNFIAVDQGRGNFRLYNFYRSILNPVYLSILTIFWFAGVRNVEPFVAALLVVNLAIVLVRISISFSSCRIFGKTFSLLSVFKQSIHFGLAGMTNPFYQQADKAILLWLIGAEHLGIYVVALSASTAIGSLTNAAGTITFTLAAQANHSEGFDPVFKVFRISMLLWMFFGGLLALSMPWILPLVYGRDFSCAIIPAQLLMAGSAAWGLSLQLEQAMRGQGRAFIGLEGRLVGLIVMAGLGIVLSKYFSLEGICVAFVIGQFFCLAVIIRRALLHYQLLWHISYFFPAKTDLITVFDALQRLLPVKRANL